MKAFKNQKGYTLLLTLIIIIVIVLFFSSFALSAMNQQKQVGITDNTYEVTAIAEMGVEYYQAKVEMAIEIARLKIEELKRKYESDIGKSNITEAELNQFKRKLDEDIKKVKSELKSAIEGYQFNHAEKTFGDYSEKSFHLLSPPEFNDEILMMNVAGNINSKEKNITAYFNFPSDLSPSSSSTIPDENDSTGSTMTYPITHINTVKIDPHSFAVTLPSLVCENPVKNVEPCKTDNLETFTTLNNNTVYYTQTDEKNFYQRQNADFGNSKIYTNGTSNFSWMENSKNITIQSNGNATFETLTNTKNISLFINGEGSFKNTLSGTNYLIYGNNKQTFTKPVTLEKSTISIVGPSIFNTTTNINTSLLNINDKVSFVGTLGLINSPTNITGSTSFGNTTKIDNSPLMIFSTASFEGTLNLINSPANIAGFTAFANTTKIVNSPLNIKDSAVFKGTLSLSDSPTNISGTAIFENTTTIENSNFIIYNNLPYASIGATFKGTLNLTNSPFTVQGNSIFNNNITVDNSNLTIKGSTTINGTANFNDTKLINISGTTTINNHLYISNSTVNFSDVVSAPKIHVQNNSTACFRKGVTQSHNWGDLLDIDAKSNIYIDEALKGTTFSSNNGKQPIFVSKKELDVLCPRGEKVPSEPSPVVEKDFINKIIYN